MSKFRSNGRKTRKSSSTTSSSSSTSKKKVKTVRRKKKSTAKKKTATTVPTRRKKTTSTTTSSSRRVKKPLYSSNSNSSSSYRKRTGVKTTTASSSRRRNPNNVVSSSSSNSRKKPTRPLTIEQSFEKYIKENEDGENEMSGSCIISFCEDIGIDPTTDISILVIAWLLKAKTCHTFSREEFVGGLKKLGCRKIDDVKKKLGVWKTQKLRSTSSFKDFYRYIFTFSVPSRTMQLEVAVPLWKLIFKNKKTNHLNDWCIFLEKVHKNSITKDTWCQLLEFVNQIHKDFSNYDDGEAWPTVMDDFVVWVKGGKKIVKEKEKEEEEEED